MPVLSVETVATQLKGVTVLLRSSLNVPIVNGEVANTFRLDCALKTITFLASHGARVVLISHIDGEVGASLKPVYTYLKSRADIQFCDDVAGEVARAGVAKLRDGQVLMLENVRRDAGEVANDEHFVRKLASLGELYVNDDFAAAHRKHASIIGIPQFLPSYAGIQFMAEVDGLSKALAPQSPSLAILGGAKFVTKEPLIRTLVGKYDKLFVGGALSTDFLKAKGLEVGRSLVSDSPHIKDLLDNSKILLPSDVTVMGVDGRDVKVVDQILESEVIYDIGPLSLAELAPEIAKARIILWNGPMGNFEQGFREMTEAMARLVAESKATTIVGGGDTIASIRRLKIDTKFTFTSTAGGAMLDFLANGTLPGIVALEQAKKLA